MKSEPKGVGSTRLGHECNTVGLLVLLTNDLEDSLFQEYVINRGWTVQGEVFLTGNRDRGQPQCDGLP